MAKEKKHWSDRIPTKEGAKTAEGITREAFIRKWLGNRDYEYNEANRDLMRDDLDKVIQSLPQSDGQRYGDRIKELENEKQSILDSFKGKMEVQSVMHQWYARKDAYLIQARIDELKHIQTLQSKEQEPKGSEVGGEQQSEYDNIEAIEMSRNKKKNNP